MNFWFDEQGNLGGLLPSRECPTCGLVRIIKVTPRGKHYLHCSHCKKRQPITEEEHHRMPMLMFQPTGYGCPQCGREISTFGQNKGFCHHCGKERAFGGCEPVISSGVQNAGSVW